LELLDAVKCFLVFVVSTSIHEAAHSWVAFKLGDDTAYRGGQVTLDPSPHIIREPIGMVLVPLLSVLLGGWMVGWASTPYDPAWALRSPRRAALMSLAGPTANLLLVITAALVIRGGVALHIFDAPDSVGFTHIVHAVNGGIAIFFAKLLSIIFSLNLLLGAFNLLPVPPLDGASLPLLFLSRNLAQRVFTLTRHPTFRTVGLLIAWRGFGALYHPLQLSAVHLLYPETSYY